MTTITPTSPGISTGHWTIDPSHSEIGFSVRHLMVSKVKGRFADFEGTINIADDPLASSVEVSVDVSSIDTSDAKRDEHLRSSDFFDVDEHRTMTFSSTAVQADGDDHYKVTGDLTLHGVTRPVELQVELNGVSPDPWGNTRIGFSAATELSRKDFGVDLEMPLDGGGVVVGDKVKVTLEIEAVHQAA